MRWKELRKFILLSALTLAIVLSGCGNSTRNLTGDAPPKVVVEADGETYETILGSNCWGSSSNAVGEFVCTDTAGAAELLEDKQSIEVEAGETITLKMDYRPQPNIVHLSEIENEMETEVKVKDGQFTAPKKQGVYYYAYNVWWMDEEDEDVSNADAVYVFALEVQ